MRKITPVIAAVFLTSWMLAPTASGEEKKPKEAEGCSACRETGQQPEGNGNGDSAAKISNCICLCYPYAFYPTHWSFYAIHCDGDEPLSYDAPPGSQLGSCDMTPPCGVCFAAPPRMAYKSGAAEWVKQDGLDYAHSPNFTPVLRGTKKTDREVPITLVKIGLPGEYVTGKNRPVFAAVFEVTVDPPDLDESESTLEPATFRTGIEITRPNTLPVNATEVEPNWRAGGKSTHCIWVTVGEPGPDNEPYHVILQQELTGPGKSAPTAGVATQA